MTAETLTDVQTHNLVHDCALAALSMDSRDRWFVAALLVAATGRAGRIAITPLLCLADHSMGST